MVGSSFPCRARSVRSRQKWSSAGVFDFLSPFPTGGVNVPPPDPRRLRRTRVGPEYLEGLRAGFFHPDTQ